MIWRRTLIDPIFATDISLIVCTIPEIRTWIQQHPDFEDHDTQEDWESAHAETLKTEHGPSRWLVWLSPTLVSVTDPESLGTLVHESEHVTAQVLRDRGVELSAESEEVFAYYQTWLFVRFLLLLQTYTHRRRRRSIPKKKRRARA